MKQRILTGWSIQRALFLIMGTAVIIQSGMEKEWMGAALGGYFAAMAIFNVGCASGCCAGGNCYKAPPAGKYLRSEGGKFIEIKKR